MSDIPHTCVICKQGFEDSNVNVKVYEKGLRTLAKVSREKEQHESHRSDILIPSLYSLHVVLCKPNGFSNQ